MMEFWIGFGLVFASGFGFGLLATMAYVGSLGWEKAGAHIHDENCGVLE